MNKAVILRSVAGVLLLLVGGLLAAGGAQLLRGGPAVWRDVVAGEAVVSRTAVGMLALGALVLVAATATLWNASWRDAQ